MTVSSTSEMMPKCTSGPTIQIGASTASAPSVRSVAWCQPGASATGTRVSTTPPRSASTSIRSPPTSMTTGTSPTGTLVKLRQPRMPCSLRRRRRFDGSSAVDRPAEEHPAEHAHPLGGAVARVRDDRWGRARAGAPSARARRGSSPRGARHGAGPGAPWIRPGSGGSPASTQSVMRPVARRKTCRAANGRATADAPGRVEPHMREVPCRMST